MLSLSLARSLSLPIHSGYDSWRRHPSHADADLHDICSNSFVRVYYHYTVVSFLVSKHSDDESGEEDAEGLLISMISLETNVSETCHQIDSPSFATSGTNSSGTERSLYTQTVNDDYPHVNTAAANQAAAFIHQLLFHT